MTLPKTSILGVSVTTSSRKQILSFLSRFFSTRRPISPSSIQIVTPNAEQIVLAQKDEKFKNILIEADIALPDGAGLVWAMNRKQKTENRKQTSVLRHPSSVLRISGVDFMVDLCRIAAEKKGRVLLYGGRGGVAGEALKKLKEHIPGLDGIAEDAPELQMSNVKCQMSNQFQMKNNPEDTENICTDMIKHLVQVIRGRNIQVVFIGLGAPKQEYLMDALRHTFKGQTLHDVYSNLVVMSVGGSFDMLAGKVRRAPKFVQTIGFEWLWRLFLEPWRIKRQLALLEFVLLVLTRKS